MTTIRGSALSVIPFALAPPAMSAADDKPWSDEAELSFVANF
jgi:hypothetical protein